MTVTNLFTSLQGATSGQLTESVLNYKLVLIECTGTSGGYVYKTSQVYSHTIISDAVTEGSVIRIGAQTDNTYCWISFSSATEFSKVLGNLEDVQYIWGIN